MRRQFNVLTVGDSSIEEAEERGAQLAGVAEPRFIDALKALFEGFESNGDRACIATVRYKYDADGEVTEDSDAPGEFRTVGYEFAGGEGSRDVARDPELEGTGVSHLLAFELAQRVGADAIRALTDLKAILDRFGGQVWISPYQAQDGITLGYLFHYDHISRVGRGKEPDAHLDEPLPLVVKEPATK